MESQNVRQGIILFATASLFASQSAMAYAFQHLELDPAPDSDLLALKKEDEAAVQDLFDQFDLNETERAELMRLIDPAVPDVPEDFVMLRELDASIPMEEHPEYIEFMERVSTLRSTPISSCQPDLTPGDYYHLTDNISCNLSPGDVGISLPAGSTLNLRGYNVTGTGDGVGIQLDEKTTLFGGFDRGIVSGFQVGIFSESNYNLILHVESSQNQSNGIHLLGDFSGSESHHFNDHRVMYSVTNNNSTGILFEVRDESTTSNNASIFANHVYETIANNNEDAISFLFGGRDTPYTRVDIYKNSISHSHVNDNDDSGIQFIVGPLDTTAGLSVRDNHVSHARVRCQSTLPCHGNGGINFTVGELTDNSDVGVEIVDNSVFANWVDYGAGTGILFAVQHLEEKGDGDIDVSRNHVKFNNASHNAEGIDMTVQALLEDNNGNINITDNLIVFNRSAYSNGDVSNAQGNGIFVDFENLVECGSGSVQITDNLIFANAVYKNAAYGVYFDSSFAPGSCISSKKVSSPWVFNDNEILFNHVFTNGIIGLYLNGQFEGPGQTEAQNNRIGFNRVLGSNSGIRFQLSATSDDNTANSSKAIYNQVEHNIVSDAVDNGIVFEVLSTNDFGSANDTSYENRVRQNFVKEISGTGIYMDGLISIGYADDYEKNGIFQNLIVGTESGIDVADGTNSLIHRNFVARSVEDGITIEDEGDFISENTSISNGGYNFVDVPGQFDTTTCNTWEDNFYVSSVTVLPPICFEANNVANFPVLH